MPLATAFARKKIRLSLYQKVERNRQFDVFIVCANRSHHAPHIQELVAEVLDLPAHDRAKILELLLSSFEPAPDSQKTWMNLASLRREQVRTGEVAMVNGVEAMSRIRARIA